MKNHTNEIYDVVIIGGGPAGLSASLYLKRSGVNVLILEKAILGGKVNYTDEVENYLVGKKIQGMELAQIFTNQIKELNVPTRNSEVVELTKEVDKFCIKLKNNEVLFSKKVIIATGTKERKLEAKNSDSFQYKGISYCAVCDGPFYKGLDVLVVGGGFAAVEEAMFLTGICKKVYLVHRRDEFRVDKNNLDKLKSKENVQIITNSVVEEISSGNKITYALLRDVKTNEVQEIKVSAIFPYIGQIPISEYVKIEEIKNNNGFIKVDDKFKTCVEGLYAVGDILDKEFRQIATAVSDGAVAALEIIKSFN